MTDPISGAAIQQAATQLRIIELDQIIDNNISDSMNFAIDFTNQTFRITGLQLRDWLSGALVFPAENVVFDSTIFASIFPLVIPPPDNAQDALDFAFTDYVSESIGGTINAALIIVQDNAALTIQGVGGVPTNIQFFSDLAADIGTVGKADNGNGLHVIAKTSSLYLESTGVNVEITAGAAVNINAPTINANNAINIQTEAFSGVRFQRASEELIGYIGKLNGENSDISFVTQVGNCIVSALNGAINLNAPITNVSGKCTILSDENPLSIRPESAGAASFIQFQNSASLAVGNIGRINGATDDLYVRSITANLKLEAAAGVIDLNAPTTIINGNATINSGNSLPLTINSTTGVPTCRIQFGIPATVTGHLWLDDLGGFVFADGGAVTKQSFPTSGDIVAFVGQANVANVTQPAIAQTGLTTSFELIEHLLDKIEDMEITISDLSTRLDNAGIL